MQEKDNCHYYTGEMFCEKKGEIESLSCCDCDCYHPNLNKSCHDLIMNISESIGIIKILDWLENKLKQR